MSYKPSDVPPPPGFTAQDLNTHLLKDFLAGDQTKKDSDKKSETVVKPESGGPSGDAKNAIEVAQAVPKDGKTDQKENPRSDSTKRSVFGDKSGHINPYLEFGDLKLDRPKVAQLEVAPKKEPEKPTPVLSADGLGAYTRDEATGNWKLTDGKGKTSTAHSDFPDKAIKNVEKQADGSVKLTLDGGKIVRDRGDGSRLHYPDDDAFKADHPNRTYRADNTYRDVEWDGNKIASFKTSTSKDRFHQVAEDQWSTDPKAKSGWKGHIEINGQNGDFTRNRLEADVRGIRDVWRSDNINETHKPDGSMEVEVPYFDGSKRIFNFKEGFTAGKDVLKQPESFKVIDTGGAEHNWKKLNGNEYDSDGEKKTVEVELTKAGKYSFKDLKSEWSIVRTPQGFVEENAPKDKSYTVTDKGKVTKAKIGDQEFDIKYGADDKPREIKHVNENRVWTKESDGSWSDAALDKSKPYVKPDAFEKTIVTHPQLNPSQMARMIENVRAFRAMPEHSDAEKAEVFKQAERLLGGRADSPFSAKEKANFADQLFWHVVKHDRNEQGQTNNCNVTVLRGLALKESPSTVAKVVADICNDGFITTQDGSKIEPKLASLKPRPGSPEDTFPPAAGARTALGKLWDVTAIDTYYRRQEKDPFGAKIDKGAMWYEEVAPTGRSDTGSRLVCLDKNGQEKFLAKNKDGSVDPIDSPRMFPSRIADSFHQMTGQTLKDRFYVHSNRYIDDEKVFKDLCDGKISNQKDVESLLAKSDRCRIFQGNTGILSLRHKQQVAVDKGEDPSKIAKPAGGEHVWLVPKFDKASQTVSIDNSWDYSYDMKNGAEAKAAGKDPKKLITMSVADLYKSMEDSSSGDSYTLTWQWRK